MCSARDPTPGCLLQQLHLGFGHNEHLDAQHSDAHALKLGIVPQINKSVCCCLQLVYATKAGERLPPTPDRVSAKLYKLEDVAHLGQQHPKAHIPPSPTDLCTICYTSGTTGISRPCLSSDCHQPICFALHSVSVQASLQSCQQNVSLYVECSMPLRQRLVIKIM